MKKKIALILVAVMLFSLPVTGLAAETTTEAAAPEAGITPDSWLYGLDNFMKELHLLVTFDAADKTGLLDDISGKRLAEARKMVEENKDEYAVIAMKAYKSALEKIVKVLDTAILDEKDIDDVLKQVSNNLIQREEQIAIILEGMPDHIRAEVESSLQTIKDDLEVTIVVTDLDGDEEPEESEENENKEDIDETSDEKSDTESDQVAEEEEESDGEDINKEADEEADEDALEEAAEEKVLPLKKVVTAEILKDKINEEVAQKFASGELNLRQIMTVASLAEQTEKSFEEVLTVFLENGKGIGATAKAMGLHPKDALKGIKEVFKGTKEQIKADFAAAKEEWKAGKIDVVPDEEEGKLEEEIEEPSSEQDIDDRDSHNGDDDRDDDDDDDDDDRDDDDDENRNKVKKNKEKNNKENNKENNGNNKEQNDKENNGKNKEKSNNSNNKSDRAKERSNNK